MNTKCFNLIFRKKKKNIFFKKIYLQVSVNTLKNNSNNNNNNIHKIQHLKKNA